MPQYNLNNSSYYPNIPQKSSEIIIYYDLLNNLIYDERVSIAYSNDFQKEYDQLLESYDDNIELPPSHIYNRIIANGNYLDNIYELPCFQKNYILGIVNRNKISPEDSTKMPTIIAKDVINNLSNRFNITSLQVIYTDLNGSLEIIIDGMDTPTVEKMQKHTDKMDRIGEKEKELIYELNK